MLLLGASFLVVDAIYLFWSLRADNFEVVGLITVGLSGVLCFLLAFYFGREVAAAGVNTPVADSADAEIDDGDAEMGFFSPWSWWPILLAAAATVLVVGLAVSLWIAIIGLPLLVIALAGLVFEYYRGYFAH